AGDDASAVLARVEKEAASAAIDDALTALRKLDGATRAPAQGGIAKAQARQAAVAAARELASQTAHALGKREGKEDRGLLFFVFVRGHRRRRRLDCRPSG